jgi:hypothetical protein
MCDLGNGSQIANGLNVDRRILLFSCLGMLKFLLQICNLVFVVIFLHFVLLFLQIVLWFLQFALLFLLFDEFERKELFLENKLHARLRS